MPLKPGGGNHMQLYDSQNGEYTEEEKDRMKSYDSFALWSYELNGNNNKFKFHFPIQGVHENEYCYDFIRLIKNSIHEPIFIEEKMKYLLTFRTKDDKSKFILSLSYSVNKPYELFKDICKNTIRDSIEFSRFSYGKIIVTAKTYLKGKLVKTIWRLEQNLDIYFVTLIPGGDKKWKR